MTLQVRQHEMSHDCWCHPTVEYVCGDEALATERRATVERIRAALKDEAPVHLTQALRNQATGPEWDDCFWRTDIDAILDEEAAR